MSDKKALQSKRAKKLTREQLLLSRPVRNPNVELEEPKDGELVLIFRRKKGFWTGIMANLFMIPDMKKFRLDEIGTFVWSLCDEKHTNGDLIKALCDRYNLMTPQAEASLVRFQEQLMKMGALGLLVPKPEEVTK